MEEMYKLNYMGEKELSIQRLQEKELLGENDWQLISITYDITDELIDAFGDKLNWGAIGACSFCIGDANFVRKHQDKLDWYTLSLSAGSYDDDEDFLWEFRDKFDWRVVFDSSLGKYSDSFKEKINNYLSTKK